MRNTYLFRIRDNKKSCLEKKNPDLMYILYETYAKKTHTATCMWKKPDHNYLRMHIKKKPEHNLYMIIGKPDLLFIFYVINFYNIVTESAMNHVKMLIMFCFAIEIKFKYL